MDIVEGFLRVVREQIQSLGVPPDALQEALLNIEYTLHRSWGGGTHYVPRLPSTKARIFDLDASGLTAKQISERLGVTDRYVRKVLELRRG